MKDYERCMNRQKMSETGMARLMKLETERPKKGERTGKQRTGRNQWLKYAGLAACLVLVVGLLAPPALRGIGQLARPGAEELYFHEVESVPFTDQAIAGGMGLNTMKPADAAAIFGSSPDDFAGFLEMVGLDKFKMEYHIVDMAAQGDGSYRFLMKGSYVSPTVEEKWPPTVSMVPVNTVWLEVYEGHSYRSEGEWSALEPHAFHGCQVTAARDENNYRAAAAFDVESGGKTYGVLYAVTTDGEANAQELATKMVAYITQSGLYIPNNELVFNQLDKVPLSVQSPYSMELTGRRDVTEDEREMLLGTLEQLGWTGLEGSASSWPMGRDPDTGWSIYYFDFNGMDSFVDPTCNFVLHLMPNMTDFRTYTADNIPDWNSLEVSQVNGHRVTAMSGKSYTPGSFYCAAAAFVVEDAPCKYGVYYAVEHEDKATAEAMVTQLVNTLTRRGLFTEMYGVHGGEDPDQPLKYAELEQTYAYVDFYKALEKNKSRELTQEDIWKVFPASAGDAGVNYVWKGTVWFQDDGNLRAVTITGDCMDGSGTVIVTTSREEELTFTRNQTRENGRITYLGENNTMLVSGVDQLRCFYVNEPGHFANAPGNYWCYTQERLMGSPLYTEIKTTVGNGSLEENKVFNTQWVNTVCQEGLWFHTGSVNGVDIWKLPGTALNEAAPEVELGGKYHMEAADGRALADSYLDIERKKPYGDIINKKMTVHFASRNCVCTATDYNAARDRVTYVCSDCKSAYTFDIVDSETLRYVASGNKDCIDGGTVFRHLKDGETTVIVFAFEDWDAALDEQKTQLEDDIAAAGHHPEPEHDVEVTHHPEPEHYVEPTHHPEPTHHAIGITEIDWTDGRWIADDQFVSYHHSSHH